MVEPAERYALPWTYGPILDPDPRPPLTLPFNRWRVTRPTVDLFTASVIALDLLLADPDPEGRRLISWQEMDAWQRSPAFQNANHLLDFISLANGRRFPIHRADCTPSMRPLPSICPKADPKPPVGLRPDGEMLAVIEARYRSLCLIGDDQSLRWIGRQEKPETTCTCNLTARPDVPRSAEWQNLRQLRQAVVALVQLLYSWSVGRHQARQLRQAGAMMSEQTAPDFQPVDRLEQHIAEAAAAAGVALPDGVSVIPEWVRDPDGLPQSEEWARWESEWRAVRVGVEARLAALDPRPLPCQAPTVPQVDTREVPLTAPGGTPSPLQEAFDAVAEALFEAAQMRRCPPTGRPLFEEEARRLSAAFNAGRERYAAAELLLQAATEDSGTCAHQEALNAVCRVNDACGHVMLGVVPFHRATAHILAVPAFDLAALLGSMRRQTSRAAVQLQAAGARPASQNRRPEPTGDPRQEPTEDTDRREKANDEDLPAATPPDAPTSAAAELTAVERAIAVYLRDPNLSVIEVARLAGCDRSLLYRDARFKRLRQAHRGTLPKGSKSNEGDLEAEDER